MTFVLLPTVTVITLALYGQLPAPPLDPYDAGPDRVQVYVEEVECITVWRGRSRQTYCRVIHRGRAPAPAPQPALKPPPAPTPTTTRFLTPGEAKVMRLLNAMRRRLRLRTLTLDKAATLVARAHSRDMCRRRFFAHKNLGGKMPWDRLKAGGVKFRAAGENIAAGQRTALEVHRDWNTSPGHRKNRLHKRYRRMGIGVYWCAGTPYWTEVFMR